jgi:hypothetical protein
MGAEERLPAELACVYGISPRAPQLILGVEVTPQRTGTKTGINAGDIGTGHSQEWLGSGSAHFGSHYADYKLTIYSKGSIRTFSAKSGTHRKSFT